MANKMITWKMNNETKKREGEIFHAFLFAASLRYDSCASIRYMIKFFASLYPSVVKNYQSFLKAVHRRCKRT